MDSHSSFLFIEQFVQKRFVHQSWGFVRIELTWQYLLTAHLHYVAVPMGSLQFDLGSEGVVSAQRNLKPESLRNL